MNTAGDRRAALLRDGAAVEPNHVRVSGNPVRVQVAVEPAPHGVGEQQGAGLRGHRRPGARGTYKILYNDAVAMTGGQPLGGEVQVNAIARQMVAEGAEKVVVMSDEPEKYPAGYRARRSARTLPSCQSHPHSMSAAADTARTDGHHPCLRTHMPTFEILRSTGKLSVRISYSPTRRHAGAVGAMRTGTNAETARSGSLGLAQQPATLEPRMGPVQRTGREAVRAGVGSERLSLRAPSAKMLQPEVVARAPRAQDL